MKKLYLVFKELGVHTPIGAVNENRGTLRLSLSSHYNLNSDLINDLICNKLYH